MLLLVSDMSIECEVCKSYIFREQLRAPCPKCDKRSCIYCSRMCDICLKIFCFDDVQVRKVTMPAGGVQLMKVCEFCKETWKG